MAGCTLRARKKAARCTRGCPRDHRGIIWELQWRTMSVHQRLCACVGEGCAACSENQWQRAPTLSVASVVECPRLATGLPMSIEASPELPGAFSKKTQRPKTRSSALWIEGGNQQKEFSPRSAILRVIKRARFCTNAGLGWHTSFLPKVSFLRRKTNNTQAPGLDTPRNGTAGRLLARRRRGCQLGGRRRCRQG